MLGSDVGPLMPRQGAPSRHGLEQGLNGPEAGWDAYLRSVSGETPPKYISCSVAFRQGSGGGCWAAMQAPCQGAPSRQGLQQGLRLVGMRTFGAYRGRPPPSAFSNAYLGGVSGETPPQVHFLISGPKGIWEETFPKYLFWLFSAP